MMFVRFVLLLILASATLGANVGSLTIREMFNLEQAYLRKHSSIDKRASEVCYTLLGCFNNRGEWNARFISLLPTSPKNMGLKFLLFTRQNPTTPDELDYKNTASFALSHYDSSKRTVVVTHGFTESSSSDWFKSFNRELLTKDDINLINVNWGSFGGSKTLYTQATANTRVVGAALGVLISELISTNSAKPEQFHLIGHSLGAHISAYGANRVKLSTAKNLARISGLDPAEPYFEEYGPTIRLDPSDADFVDVIHSDGDSIYGIASLDIGGFGMWKACGHADFYPNGGEDQPGCDRGISTQIKLEGSVYNGVKQYVACDHIRAIRFFNHSINACSFKGYECPNPDSFFSTACKASCSSTSCNQMGYDAKKPPTNKKYYLFTTADPPYCVSQYETIKLTLMPKTSKLKGQLKVRLVGPSDTKSTQATATLDGSKSEFVMKVAWEGRPSSYSSMEVLWNEDVAWWRVVTSLCRWATFCSGNFAGVKAAEVQDSTGRTLQQFCGGEVPDNQPKESGMKLLPGNTC